MDQLAQAPRLIRFGVFELDLRTGELRKSGLKLRLHGQPVEILKILLERSGEMVTREELEKRLWVGDTVVEFEHSINAAVNRLREALGDSADNPRFIETLARRGYRLIYPVEVGAGLRPAPTVPAMSSSPADGEDAAATTPSAPVAPVSPPVADVGAGLALPSGTQQAAPLQKRWRLALAATGIVGVLTALLALNVGGLRERLMAIVGAGPRPAPGQVADLPLQKIQSIAVLPLENLSGDPEQEYFADGMTEELITSLGKIGSLRVISRTSVMQFKGARPTGGLAEIAQKLNVDAVVEGSVMRSGDCVRITANLLDARSERHLWAEAYDRDLRDVLALQSEVAQAIAKEIKIKVTPDERVRLAHTHPVDPEAHELYLKGLYYWDRRSGGGLELDKAIKFFQQAIDKDPGYSLAYSGLADAYSSQVAWGILPSREGSPKGRSAAEKALQIDDMLGEAHVSLAYSKTNDWDLPGAEEHFKRGMELNPGYAKGHMFFALALTKMGRFAEAIAEVNRAYYLDPLSVITTYVLGVVFYQARRYDEAVEWELQTIAIDPNFAGAHTLLGQAYVQQSKYTPAIDELQKAETLSGGNPSFVAALGHAYAVSGNKTEALRVLGRLRKQSNEVYGSSLARAAVYSGLGDKDLAFTWLNRTFEERDSRLMNLMVDPLFDPLRSDPRFQDLLRRMNFPP